MNLSAISDSLPRKAGTQPTRVRSISWAAVVYIIIALGVMAMVAFAIFQPLLVLPRMGLSPGVRLIDQFSARCPPSIAAAIQWIW